MTDTARPAPAGQVLILAADDFGHEVAAGLAGIAGDPTVVDVGAGTHESLWPYADLVILATGAPRHRIADAVDRTAFRRAVPWFPVFLRPVEIHCGPVVVPGRTACLDCFDRRRAQHSRSVSGPAQEIPPTAFGYARHHVAIAVALARRAVLEATGVDRPDSLGATVRTFGIVTGATAQVPVVAVDGCRRCRGRFGPVEEERRALWAALAAAAGRSPADEPPVAVRTVA